MSSSSNKKNGNEKPLDKATTDKVIAAGSKARLDMLTTGIRTPVGVKVGWSLPVWPGTSPLTR